MKPSHWLRMGLLSLLFGCDTSAPYHKKDGAWFWKGDRMSVDAGVKLKPLSDVFAVAGNHAYYRGDEIAESDAGTFQALDDHYAKDKDSVYYCDTFRKSQEYWLVKRGRSQVIDSADAATFQLLTRGYARDKARIYYEGTAFPVRDAATFEVLYSNFARDKVTGYYLQHEVSGSDGASFEGLTDHYARDKAHVWYSDIVRDGGAHPGATVNVLLSNADPATFAALDKGYAKDARQVYFEGRVVKGADVATFVVADAPTDSVDARDAHASYLSGRRGK